MTYVLIIYGLHWFNKASIAMLKLDFSKSMTVASLQCYSERSEESMVLCFKVKVKRADSSITLGMTNALL